jgi:hypothetical protein
MDEELEVLEQGGHGAAYRAAAENENSARRYGHIILRIATLSEATMGNVRDAVRIAMLILLLASARAWAVEVSIVPAQPRFMEPVYARVAYPFEAFNFRSARVSMSGNDIRVDLAGYGDLGTFSFDVGLGRLPAGHYTVTMSGNPLFASPRQVASFDVAPANVPDPLAGQIPAVNYSDLWWDPTQPGWGLNIVQGATNEVFATFCTYDAAGRPTWYTLQPGAWSANGTSYQGPVYQTSNVPGTGVAVRKAGQATLSFDDAFHGRFAWTIDGSSSTAKIERLAVE